MYKFVLLFAVVAVTACSAKESAPATTTDSTTVVTDTTAVVPTDTATPIVVK